MILRKPLSKSSCESQGDEIRQSRCQIYIYIYIYIFIYIFIYIYIFKHQNQSTFLRKQTKVVNNMLRANSVYSFA